MRQVFQNLIDAIGWTLIHFVWQAFLFALLLWLLFELIPKRHPRIRYWIACATLLSICTATGLTFLRSFDTSQGSPAIVRGLHEPNREINLEQVERPKGESTSLMTVSSNAFDSTQAKAEIESGQVVRWIVLAWAIGVFIFALRLARSMWRLQSLRRQGTTPEQQSWSRRFEKLVERLSMGRSVQLLESRRATIPMVIGCLKPVVLVPVGFLSSLPPWQIESILVHELAHVRRADYLVNLLQSVVEGLFFFHPAVWWVGRQLRIERECCCDQIAANHAGGSVLFARALADLEESCQKPNSQVSVAANGASLLSRIRRLTSTQPRSKPVLPVLAILTTVMVFIAYFGSTSFGEAKVSPQDSDEEQAKPEIRLTPTIKLSGQDALLVRVLDDASGEPIKSFTMVSGVPIRQELLSKRFVERYGEVKLVNWQSHTLRNGENGEFRMPLARLYNPLCIRIEAQGYSPQQFQGIDKTKGAQTIVFRLRKHKGLKGVVLLPNGKPASGAEISVGITSRIVQIENGNFKKLNEEASGSRKAWTCPVVKADKDGRFVIPNETEPSAKLVAVHRAGICLMDFADFRNRKPIVLKNWARIECSVKVGRHLAPHEKLTLSMNLEKPIYPNSVNAFSKQSSDMSGRCVFEKVPPGVGQIQMDNYLPKFEPRAFRGHMPPIPRNAIKSISLQPGENAKIVVGGFGLEDGKNDKLVEIDSDGKISLDGQMASLDSLAKLKADYEVTIRAHKDLEYKMVAEVLSVLRQVGIKKIRIVQLENTLPRHE